MNERERREGRSGGENDGSRLTTRLLRRASLVLWKKAQIFENTGQEKTYIFLTLVNACFVLLYNFNFSFK